MSNRKRKKNNKNKVVDKIVNNGLISLAIIFIIYSIIVVLYKPNDKLWYDEFNDEVVNKMIEIENLGNYLYRNIKLINMNNVLEENINTGNINNSLMLALGFIYASNNNLLHSEEIITSNNDLQYKYTGEYLVEDEMINYVNSIVKTDTLIMEDVILDNGILKYNDINNTFEYWINPIKNNIVKTSKIYTTCDDKYLYIHEFVSYYNSNLIDNRGKNNIIYPNSYSNKNYNLGLYVNDDNISYLIDKIDLDEYIYTFIKDGNNYYLDKIEYF